MWQIRLKDSNKNLVLSKIAQFFEQNAWKYTMAFKQTFLAEKYIIILK